MEDVVIVKPFVGFVNPWDFYGPVFPGAFDRRTNVTAGVRKVEELCSGIDLSAFPLPMRVAMNQHSPFSCSCGNWSSLAAHVYMKILPRSSSELSHVEHDADGRVELRTCTGVTQRTMDEEGFEACLERVRKSIKEMVLHEVYEALLFRGERIMDPHNYRLRPTDQPF